MIVVVKKCAECPFAVKEQDTMACAVSTPKLRPLLDFPERPQWCKLRKEQVIVREFQ